MASVYVQHHTVVVSIGPTSFARCRKGELAASYSIRQAPILPLLLVKIRIYSPTLHRNKFENLNSILLIPFSPLIRVFYLIV